MGVLEYGTWEAGGLLSADNFASLLAIGSLVR